MDNQWDGDIEKLRGLERYLADNPALCDETFANKHEAFTAGLLLADGTLAAGQGESVADSIAALHQGGLIRWNGQWRNGSPVWITANSGLRRSEYSLSVGWDHGDWRAPLVMPGVDARRPTSLHDAAAWF
jgi:hypothetical protein